MSADNTVVIGYFPKSQDSNDYVYRVAHGQAAENLDDDKDYPSWFIDTCRVMWFGDAKVFEVYEEALDYAERLEKEQGYVEYGIEVKKFTRPLLALPREAAALLNNAYWNHKDKKSLIR